MNTKHTPLPWKSLLGVNFGQIRTAGHAQLLIAELSIGETKVMKNGWAGSKEGTIKTVDVTNETMCANGRLIVLAVNSHVDLVEALERLVSLDVYSSVGEINAAIDQARAALSKAKGE